MDRILGQLVTALPLIYHLSDAKAHPIAVVIPPSERDFKIPACHKLKNNTPEIAFTQQARRDFCQKSIVLRTYTILDGRI
ncbi:hypothetical protein [Microcoleus sp. D2_18a_D3]|uniref:hypothetical protein n=1 Tax=Microcoleus sp. D2_18a_D3 TaxID=3055330 RepID=UPI002FD7091A